MERGGAAIRWQNARGQRIGRSAIFEDRREAGRKLAASLGGYSSDTLVLALPRGGVPVAFEVAKALGAALEVLVVRKLGAPGREELALGAIATGGVRIFNEALVQSLGVTEAELEAVAERERLELTRRETLYRSEHGPLTLEGRSAILVDDGLATGATMRSAVAACRALKPKHLAVAAPLGSSDTCAQLEREVDEVLCLQKPQPFYGVGRWYKQFPQVTDDEVKALLDEVATWSLSPKE